MHKCGILDHLVKQESTHRKVWLQIQGCFMWSLLNSKTKLLLYKRGLISLTHLVYCKLRGLKNSKVLRSRFSILQLSFISKFINASIFSFPENNQYLKETNCLNQLQDFILLFNAVMELQKV